MCFKNVRIGKAVAAFILMAVSTSQGAQYSITDIGIVAGAEGSTGYAINENGQVTGESFFSASEQRAFLYSNGTIQDLNKLGPGTGTSYGQDINDSGQIAGSFHTYQSNVYTIHAFLYSNGNSKDLGVLPGGDMSIAFGISNIGLVTGISNTEDGEYHAFLSYSGLMIDLGTLFGGSFSYGLSVNDSLQVTGYGDTFSPNFVHAFLFDGMMHDLGTLGGAMSAGESINVHGQVAGYSDISGGGRHAFLYTNGKMNDLGGLNEQFENTIGFGLNNHTQVVGTASDKANDNFRAFIYDPNVGMTDLNTLIDPSTGWFLTRAYAINDAGQITGVGVTSLGEQHAFILTPVPEPSSLTLVVCGSTLFVVFAFRRIRIITS